MPQLPAVDNYLIHNMEQSIAELSRLVAQPSVAAQNWGIPECAELVAGMLRKRDFKVEVIATGGSPVVFAERTTENNEDAKTLLFYNHYDVQPPEPLELWESPPFEPQIRDNKLFGRGVSDDKGHITSRLFAIDALLETQGDLPCNVKFVIEGEEETSSQHLADFVKGNASKLEADACIWEFGGVDHRDVPLQYLGLRGICYVELSVKTADVDVHSGLGGSIFPNAAWRLVWALNSLKDEKERILLPGFYDDIIPYTKRDQELFAALPDMAEEYTQRYGVSEFIKGLNGGIDLRIAEVFEPSCTICGLSSGYQGKGPKTVLPAEAKVKIDFRLVPRQTPQKVLSALREHLDNQGFADVNIEYLGGESPSKTDPDDPFVELVVQSAESVYTERMQVVPMVGGSGPGHIFEETLKIPIATAGIGHPGSQAHAPNENIRLDLYLKGAQHIARILTNFGTT